MKELRNFAKRSVGRRTLVRNGMLADGARKVRLRQELVAGAVDSFEMGRI